MKNEPLRPYPMPAGTVPAWAGSPVRVVEPVKPILIQPELPRMITFPEFEGDDDYYCYIT